MLNVIVQTGRESETSVLKTLATGLVTQRIAPQTAGTHARRNIPPCTRVRNGCFGTLNELHTGIRWVMRTLRWVDQVRTSCFGVLLVFGYVCALGSATVLGSYWGDRGYQWANEASRNRITVGGGCRIVVSGGAGRSARHGTQTRA